MRITFVTPFYKPHYGGIERFIDSLGHALSARGSAEVSIITTRSTYKQRLAEVQSPGFDDAGMKVIRLRSAVRDPHTYGHPVSVGLFLRGLGGAIRALDPDIVHLTNGGWFLPNLQAALGSSGRKVGASPFHHRLPPSLGNLPQIAVNSALYRRLEFVHAVTASEADAIRRSYRLRGPGPSVIPLGVPVSGSPPDRSKRNCILFVGRISRYKGTLLAAQSFILAAPSLPSDFSFVVAGDDGGELSAVRAAFKTAGMESRLEVHSRLDDGALAELYRRACALILPSKDEAFAFVIFEALSNGCPVVVSDLASLRELLPQGAAFVPRSGPDAFAAALVNLATDEAAWKEASRTGAELVRSRHSLDHMVRGFEELYRSLMG